MLDVLRQPARGLEARLDKIRHADLIKVLFSENRACSSR